LKNVLEFFCGINNDISNSRAPLKRFFSNELLKLIYDNKMRCFLIGMKFTRPNNVEDNKGNQLPYHNDKGKFSLQNMI
jgi:hypothetical protein